ncbi:cysteine desulfuration protein SufE [Quadrisphaera granulorum]|uniref:Cysteine desulfuration protein SufE n=1 Tax=Quadrisphaera granulorum TaxID=317664 RepID=A0A316A6E4_9ACTN|nr:SufE family protein [Quadrisphaera granulorum]PWJ53496.1 cysteine desulfuration protein SufE [Quadrisphaera granulorum]SZE96838.1 cysteine desulfuration protein SufE [Quadrisphaera granulorum]
MSTTDLPPKLAAVVDDFDAVGERERLQLLLEFSEGLPELPERYTQHPELLEPVPECQSPVFVVTELEDADHATPPLARIVRVFASAPREAPTTRGFAGILCEGLDGLPAGELLAVPDDFCDRLGLGRAVSPLRMRGMSGMLGRIKRQVRERTAA